VSSRVIEDGKGRLWFNVTMGCLVGEVEVMKVSGDRFVWEREREWFGCFNFCTSCSGYQLLWLMRIVTWRAIRGCVRTRVLKRVTIAVLRITNTELKHSKLSRGWNESSEWVISVYFSSKSPIWGTEKKYKRRALGARQHNV
jgi:hypothetical protein